MNFVEKPGELFTLGSEMCAIIRLIDSGRSNRTERTVILGEIFVLCTDWLFDGDAESFVYFSQDSWL